MMSHTHEHAVDYYSCQHPNCKAARLVNSSVDDLRASLHTGYYNADQEILRIALEICQQARYPTKAKLIQAQLNRLAQAK